MANFYLISFDPTTTDATSLHEVIKNAGFLSWWHYLGSSYIIKTKNRNLDNVHNLIKTNWPGNRFLIVKIMPEFRNGWLTPDAWKWFREKVD